MTERELIELRDGLQSPFGRWVIQFIKEQITDLESHAETGFPSNLGDLIEREQIFGKIKALKELVSEIPNSIDEQLKNINETSNE